MSLTKVTYSMIEGAPTNVLDYIPANEHAAILAGTSTYDCGPSITTAINALKGTTDRKTLYFPKGTYVVNTMISISDIYGFVFRGDGSRGTSMLKYTKQFDALFFITRYVTNAFYDLEFVSSVAAPAVPNNVAFRLDGTGGGTEMLFQNCRFVGFDTALQTTLAVGNDDTFTFNNCYFAYNANVWVNTNDQAVIWTFNQCQVLYTTNIVFDNPGGFLRVNGGSYINQGTFCNFDSINAYGIEFNSVKFETTQNFTPPGTPKWLTIGGTSFAEVFFNRCNDVGGGAYTGETFYLTNLFRVTFDESTFANGYMTIDSNTSSNGVAGTLTVNNSTIPRIIETVYPSNGNLPSTKFYRNSTVSNATYNANFEGSTNRVLSTQSTGLPVIPAQQKLLVTNANIGSTTTGFNFYVPVPVGGLMTISGLDLYYEDGSGATATITLYTDSTKTTTIYSYSKGASPGIKVDSKSITGLTSIYTMTNSSNRLYLEVVPAGDISIPTISLILKLSPFY